MAPHTKRRARPEERSDLRARPRSRPARPEIPFIAPPTPARVQDVPMRMSPPWRSERRRATREQLSSPTRRATGAAIVIACCFGMIAAGAGGDQGAGDPKSAEERSTPAPATQPAQPTTDGMRWIPAGEFTMGSDDPKTMPNERPARRVRVDGFWMDETPVTNAQYRNFAEATGYVTVAERPVDWEEIRKQVPPGTPKPPDEALAPGSLVFTPPKGPVDLREMAAWWTWTTGANWRHPQGPASTIEGLDDYPVLHIAYEDAVAYANWAKKRLPTEAEWEYASGGGVTSNTRYWWGDEFVPTVGPHAGRFMANTFTGDFPWRNTVEDGFAGVAPVRAFPANGYGLHGMSGNVWNWTSDLYRADAHARAMLETKESGAACCHNPTGPRSTFDPSRHVPAAEERVIKGGSFLCNPSYCESYRPTARRGTPIDTGTGHIGFRCVRSGPGPEGATPAPKVEAGGSSQSSGAPLP